MNREEIINNYSKSEFMNFLEKDYIGKVLDLFNEEGINILKNSSIKEERIRYILTYCKYKDQLLQNPLFLNTFLNSDISEYYANLDNLDYKTYDAILKMSNDLNKKEDFISEIFNYFNEEYQVQKIDNLEYNEELIYEILKNSWYPNVIQKIMDKYNIDLTLHNINILTFFEKGKTAFLKAMKKKYTEGITVSDFHVPPKMITKKIIEKLWNDYDVFAIRAIINDASYSCDTYDINKMIRNKEDENINKFNDNTLMFPFDDVFSLYKDYRKIWENAKTDEEYSKCRNLKISLMKLFEKLEKLDRRKSYFGEIEVIYVKNGLDGVFEYLKNISNNTLSNYIIDYHFEENYYNIMIDVRELLNFYYQGNIVIPKERVELYETISNIDNLSVDEKKELHNDLKNYNIKELFYDDMKYARYIVGEAIKEYSLSKEELKKYKDENLSKEYGVDVYKIENENFFAIVKTGRHPQNELPSGHSYSIIGKGGITVFGNAEDSNTFLYDSSDMNPEQLIHVFPYDSFTLYAPFECSTKATNRVNMLSMPNELMSDYWYNELLLLERGKNEVGIEQSIPELKKMALYCLDEIRSQDVEAAKTSEVGIFLISSKKYKKSDVSKKIITEDIFDHNYFDGITEREEFEKRR